MSTVSGNGEIIVWKIPVKNLSGSQDTNVIVTGAFPAGVSYVSHVVPAGTTFNPTGTPTWTIPVLPAGQVYELKVSTIVTDISQAPFDWTLTVDGDNIDSNAGNNTKTYTVTSTVCSPAAGAVGGTMCACVNLSKLDSPCTQCTTEWRVDALSLTNLEQVSFDGATGIGYFRLLDPTIDGSFQYNIWCNDCADTMDYDVSGPATVTIPKLYSNPDYQLAGLETHVSMAAAFASLGAGKRFIWAQANVEGVISPWNSSIGISRNPI